MPNKIYSFEPIIDQNSKILILGTLPGPESLTMSQYYANPHNQFWNIVYTVFEEKKIGLTYQEKTCFLTEHKLALWDIFYSADRIGALDADIKNGTPNKIPELLENHPGIKRILLNGRKADEFFRKFFPNITIDAAYVPSTSPAYAKKSLPEKMIDWKSAIIDEGCRRCL